MAKDYPYRDKSVVEDRFIYKNFPCVVIFRHLGFRCGYVGIPKTHKDYGKDFKDLDYDVHGRLMYSEATLFGQEDKDLWWLGFDCGHGDDGTDYEAVEKYFGNDKDIMRMTEIAKKYDRFDIEPKSKQFCILECEKLANLLFYADCRTTCLNKRIIEEDKNS